MCGIAGLIADAGISPEQLSAMSTALAHRGPDGFGYALYSSEDGVRTWINRTIPTEQSERSVLGFAHRRLSIIDLSEENAQPMCDRTGRCCVAYNGEIYNYVELRKELEVLGFGFETTGDTEVLLNAYSAWGPDCVERFNGMWAFALLDAERRIVLLSRDRFGIKPLYYSFHFDGTFSFASEIKGLLAGRGEPCAPDVGVLAGFLAQGRRPGGERTFFEGIQQLPPAHSAVVRLDQIGEGPNVSRYWSLPEARESYSKRRAVREFGELFADAVRIHARSDVPVGTCLSGGLDSSSIVCVAEGLRKDGRIPRYAHTAIGYCASEQEFSERRYMEEVARATLTRMHYVTVDDESLSRDVDRIVSCQDEPFDSASIAVQWYVFARAREEGLKVMLDGQGADEALAGYLNDLRLVGAYHLSRGHRLAAVAFASRYLLRYGEWLLPPVTRPLKRRAARLVSRFRTKGQIAARKPKGRAGAEDDTSSAITWELRALVLPKPRREPGDLDGMLRLQLQERSLPGLLRFEDRNSMAHSIESRVPFLDHRLIELDFRLPLDLLIHGLTTKYVLREAMRGILPETIRARRDKIGFRASPRLTMGLVEKRKDLLLSQETALEREWFDREGIKALLARADTEPSLERRLWKLLNVKLWAREHWG